MRKGTKHTEESLEKMRAAKRGENHPMWGRKHTALTKAKMSKKKQGKNHPNYKGNDNGDEMASLDVKP